MKRRRYSLSIFFRSYIPLILSLFTLLSAPQTMTDKVRERVIRLFVPLWEGISKVNIVTKALTLLFQEEYILAKLQRAQVQIQQLQLDNLHLLSQLNEFAMLNDQEQDRAYLLRNLEEEIKFLQNTHLSQDTYNQLKQTYSNVEDSRPARVVYRDFNQWSSIIWVDPLHSLHKSKVKDLPKIHRNSPVLVGKNVVGIVDYVGKRYCRVRLITDSSLNIAVRAVRGSSINRERIYHWNQLCHSLSILASNPDWKDKLLPLSKKIKKEPFKNQQYLAKGFLAGSYEHDRGDDTITLLGKGFNYDHADAFGHAQEYSIEQEYGVSPLIQQGDMLVTSGLDGTFPCGLPIAQVKSCVDLREGACTYTIKAKPLEANLNSVSIVSIIPPQAPPPFEVNR